MLDLDTRTAVLRLHREGQGLRAIARLLGISRNSVKAVVASGTATVPVPERPELAEPHEALILELHVACKGNLVRVHEELGKRGVTLAYTTLTAFCRRHEIGTKPKTRSGTYTFEPGEEMQHDTSPHRITIGGKPQLVQCASLVLCFCRMRFVQMYPVFNRFTCKVFLTDALEYFGGAAARCMIDNTHVVLAGGSGKDAIVAPEMLTFSERFGFAFLAHAVGDANRSARVERRFHHIEHNFYPGRTFADFADLNAQAIAWCDQTNATRMKHIGAVPLHLFQTERVHLKPLPGHVPEVYLDHLRSGDLEGYVRLHTNRYSVPDACIGRELRVRETKDRVRIFDGHALVADHERQPDRAGRRRTLPEHEHRGRAKGPDKPSLPEEAVLRAAGQPFGELVELLRKRNGGRAVRPLRQLHRLFLDYPKEPLVAAIEEALRYGLSDLERIERMTLRRVAGDYFRLPPPTKAPGDGAPPTENDPDG